MNYYEQESDRLYYRKVTEKDIPEWEKFFEDPDNYQYLGLPVQGTPNELANFWIEKQRSRYEEFGIGHLTARLKSTNELVGMVGILPRELSFGNFKEIGYSVLPKFWKQGFASEMSQQLKHFGYVNNMTNDGFISMIHPDNIGSMRVAANNGMKRRGSTFYIDIDVVIFADFNIIIPE